MLIRPTFTSDNNLVKEPNFRSNTFKNELYICPVDSGFDPLTGQLIYDVVLISEIVGDIPGTDETDIRCVDNLGKAFGKIVHHFTGRIYEGNVDINNPKEVATNMTLYPIVSYITSFKDMYIRLGSTQVYRHDTKRYTSLMYKLLGSKYSRVDEYIELARHILKLDIPNPMYPALRIYKDERIPPTVASIESPIKGHELLNALVNLKVYDVKVDFAAEEKARVERNNGIRALLGSPADDSYGENDPLVDRITLGNMARNIAIDFMRADLGGMMESCTIIFDNKILNSNSGLYSGFKSLVSPFGELYPAFDDSKSVYIAHEFDKICKWVIGTSTPRHYRVTLNSNQYEITVKVSILDETTPQDMIGLYDFKKSVTIKMKKSEAILEFVTQFVHTQNELKDYYN